MAGRSQSRRIAGGAIRLLVGTLMSRVLGFVREMLAAHYFGGRTAMDVFNVAFMVPNLFRGMLAEQAVESAFLPTFKSMLTQGKVREAWRTASVVLNWLMVALVTVVVLCFVFAPFLTSEVFAPGFGGERAGEAARMGRWMCPFMLMIGLVAFFGSLLLAHGQFWAYGIAPALFNVVSISCIVLLYRRLGLYSLVVGVMAGVFVEFIGAVVPLGWGRRRGLVQGRCHVSEGFVDAGAVRVARLAPPVCLGALVARCDYIVARAVASFLQVGSIAALGYATQLTLLSSSLFGLSVGRAALVPLSEQAARNDGAGFQRGLGAAVRLGLMLLIPLSVGTAILAHPLAALLQSGHFGPSETDMTARALRYYGFGLASMGLVSILSRALYALKDTKAPLRASVRALMANLILSPLLALTRLEHGGIALAASIAMTFQATLLFVSLRRKLREMGVIERGHWFGMPVVKACVAAVVMCVWVLPYATVTVLASPSLIARVLNVVVPGIGGAAIYGLTMFLLDREAIVRLLRKGTDR